MKILFICRGNTFRSVIAEAYLKSLRISGIDVSSRGTVAAIHHDANISNFEHTLSFLEHKNLTPYTKRTFGEQLSQQDLDDCDIAVFMNERIHEECIGKYSMPLDYRTWDINDLGEGAPWPENEEKRLEIFNQDYLRIVKRVDRLIDSILA